MAVDFSRTADDYARFRAGFPDALFDRLLSAYGVGRAGQRVLDLGTGTGALARQLARRGCEVTGLDPSVELVGQARALDGPAGVHVEYVMARAEQTGLPDRSFEVVTAGQCWHWFDRAAAANEVRRLLVPGGALVIAHFDWVPLPGNVAFETEQLILAHNPAWTMGGGTGLYPLWLRDAGAAGFEAIESFSFDVPVAYSHDAWRGRIRASAGVGASLSPEGVARFDGELGRLLAERFPADPVSVLHRVFAVVCHSP